jgi:hypothetical protein
MEYRIVEKILAELRGAIAGEELPAFRSRLRVLRDKGIPDLEKPGKGSRVSYSFEDLWEIGFALSLETFGLPPQKVEKIVHFSRGLMLDDTREQEKKIGKDIWAQIVALYLNPSDPSSQSAVSVQLAPLKVHMSSMLSTEEPGTSLLFGLINLSALTREIEQIAAKHVK